MSILEIILYSGLGLAFTGWLIYTLIKFKKQKNGTWKKKDDDEN